MIIKALRHIFPKVRRYPHRHLSEWPVWEDPQHKPLEDHEHGAGPVRPLALLIDYELHGKARLRKVVVG
jgi:hypothetical protein